jgi:hypothetical protein
MQKTGKTLAMLITLIYLTSIVVFPLSPVRAEPKTINVPVDYPTIQDAIDGANVGDIIIVENGTYEGPINQTIIIDKSISIIGDPSEQTILNLHPKYNVTQILSAYFYNYTDSIQIQANDVKLENLTIDFIGNMKANGDRLQIIGLSISSHSTVTVLDIKGNDCNVANNIFTGYISVEGSSNVISGNKAFCLHLKNSNLDTVRNNEVDTFWMESSNSNTFYKNSIKTENVQIIAALTTSNDNIFYENYFETAFWNTNLELKNSSNNIFYTNTFLSNIDTTKDYTNASDEDKWILAQYTDKDLVVVDSTSFNNSWNNSVIGNYWGNYILRNPNSTDIDSSGIGKIPYVIDKNNIDFYPLTVPVNIYEALNPTATPKPSSTSNSTPTPTIGEFSSLQILMILVGLISISIVTLRKRNKTYSKLFSS